MPSRPDSTMRRRVGPSRGRLRRRDQQGAPSDVTYGWNGLDRLRQTTVGVATRTYQHDLGGRLVAIRGGAELGDPDRFFLYRDGLEPVAWTRGDVRQYYVYGSQPHVPDLIYEDSDSDEQIDATYRVVTDERGSVRLVVRLDGGPIEVVQRIEYDAWGLPTFAVGDSSVQPFGFAGAIHLPHPGLWHMGAREYDPTIGRWISKDPIRFAGGTGLYLYCENEPVNCVDWSGEKHVPLNWYQTAAESLMLGRAYWMRGGYPARPTTDRPTAFNGLGGRLVGEEEITYEMCAPNGPNEVLRNAQHYYHARQAVEQGTPFVAEVGQILAWNAVRSPITFV